MKKLLFFLTVFLALPAPPALALTLDHWLGYRKAITWQTDIFVVGSLTRGDRLASDARFDLQSLRTGARLWLRPWLGLGASWQYLDVRLSDPAIDHYWLGGNPILRLSLRQPLTDAWIIFGEIYSRFPNRTGGVIGGLNMERQQNQSIAIVNLLAGAGWFTGRWRTELSLRTTSPGLNDPLPRQIDGLRAAWQSDSAWQVEAQAKELVRLGPIHASAALLAGRGPIVTARAGLDLALAAGVHAAAGWDSNLLVPEGKDLETWYPRPPWYAYASLYWTLDPSTLLSSNESQKGRIKPAASLAQVTPATRKEVALQSSPPPEQESGQASQSATSTTATTAPSSFEVAILLFSRSGQPLSGTVSDTENPKLSTHIAPRQAGRLQLLSGNYRLVAVAEGFQPAVTTAIVYKKDFGINLFLAPETAATAQPVHLLKEKKEIRVDETIGFELNSARLRVDSYPLLNRIAIIMEENPEIDLQIVGHTDETGTASFNLDLSARRADHVGRYLQSLGVDPGRITTAGKGKSAPLCTHQTPTCQEKNRRVEFNVDRR